MQIHTPHLRLDFDERGSLCQVSTSQGALLTSSAPPEPLFRLRHRDAHGVAHDLSAFEMTLIRLEQRTPDRATLTFETSHDAPVEMRVQVRVQVTLDPHSSLSRWQLSLFDPRGLALEWVALPGVVVADDFAALGGPGRLLWPGLEGTLIEDPTLRDRSFMRSGNVEYPSRGWEGFFPGACCAQFMAYLRGGGGLYLGAHDPQARPKVLEYHTVPGGVRLELRWYPGGSVGGYSQDFEVVLGGFEGDWYAAAEIYRRWWDAENTLALQKLSERDDLPAWLEDSPLTVIYPVRGEGDTGGMAPNALFPYLKALPTLETLAERTDSRILALLMHWEGTAPWAPPYVWPPYGGEAALSEFIEAMHAQRHLVGVYGSGLGWTQQSLLVDYDRSADFEALGVAEAACTAPDGSLPFSKICAGDQRWGYDLCPSVPWTREVFRQEALRVARSGCDYFQALDQNVGGTSYFCYSRQHGHAPVPGAWQVEAMQGLLLETQQALLEQGSAMVLGTEAAAAPPYIGPLVLNDARWNMALIVGTPVPLYAYLYHEVASNFLGNQVWSYSTLDVERDPHSLTRRLAYAFSIGDLLAFTLRVQGGVDWGWNASSASPPPDQDAALDFARLLNAWRRSTAHYLRHGRMHTPWPVSAAPSPGVPRRDGSAVSWPDHFTSRWEAPDGSSGQFFVNPTTAPLVCTLHPPQAEALFQIGRLSLHPDASPQDIGVLGHSLTLELPPLSCALLEWTRAATPQIAREEVAVP